MTDADLLAFGCTVTFVALAGAYVYAREYLFVGTAERTPAQAHAPARRQLAESRTR